MDTLRFDGRVVIVTGAGAGLGRAYALLFASKGAKVVVNDLGGGRDGDGKSSRAADNVVDEIRKNGGVAVADYNSVVEGEKVIKTAIDNFGRVDVLVNNAGILRDKSLVKISDQDWDLIHAVHLKGSFKTTQAAFPYFKKQNYGRIIMTASNSGVYGNFGQANYSAAKMGLIGLANTIAIEGQKYNIHCNVIIPTAASRLTEDVMPPDVFNELKPELIAPVVAYLCHESCEDNASYIDTAAGWAGKYKIVRSRGALLRNDRSEPVTIENVKNAWDKVTDMRNPKTLNGLQDTIAELMSAVGGESDEDVVEEPKQVISKSLAKDDNVYEYNSKDAILYALGVGASVSRAEDLKFIYENHEDFQVLPSFFVLPGMQTLFMSDIMENAVPGKTINLAQVLHGEQYVEILGDIPTDGALTSKASIVEVLDKGSGAAITVNIDSYNQQGQLVLRNQTVTFAVGCGNFGGPRTGSKTVPSQPKPSRNPDKSLTQKTSGDQAALYRLSGDLNPLHIDPNMALVSGFKQPILHGLCTFGFSVRLVLQAYAGDDTKMFKCSKARFSKPVIPGQTLRVDMWQEGNRVYFETSVQETNTVVITGAYIDLISIKMPEAVQSSDNLASDAVFEFIADQVKLDPAKAKSVGGVFLYKITKDGKVVREWTMDLPKAKVYKGSPEGKAQTTMTVSDEDFLLLSQGKLNPQVAFMKGKLKITGNIMLAQKLTPILKANASKL